MTNITVHLISSNKISMYNIHCIYFCYRRPLLDVLDQLVVYTTINLIVGNLKHCLMLPKLISLPIASTTQLILLGLMGTPFKEQ